ncbi:DUF2482 family protein [Staphylococcus saprophyticus]|nr:DUF2482 family protein [Staphylococcus saprophyticus]
MTLENLNQSELQAKISEKVAELHELIMQIDEETEFEAFGTVLYGINDNDHVLAGGTQYGAAVDIAQLLTNSEELEDIQTAIVAISLGALGEDE